MTAPVMYDASSDAMNLTAAATSAGEAKRPAGMPARYSFRRSSGSSAVISVSTKPGATTLAVIPRPPSSREIDRANPTSADLLAE